MIVEVKMKYLFTVGLMSVLFLSGCGNDEIKYKKISGLSCEINSQIIEFPVFNYEFRTNEITYVEQKENLFYKASESDFHYEQKVLDNGVIIHTPVLNTKSSVTEKFTFVDATLMNGNDIYFPSTCVLRQLNLPVEIEEVIQNVQKQKALLAEKDNPEKIETNPFLYLDEEKMSVFFKDWKKMKSNSVIDILPKDGEANVSCEMGNYRLGINAKLFINGTNNVYIKDINDNKYVFRKEQCLVKAK